jgi:hypothetical protein
MPDNWGFVAAAYGLTALVLGLYWRRLVRREKELRARAAGSASGVAGTGSAVAERRRQASRAAPPRSEPAAKPPLQQ